MQRFFNNKQKNKIFNNANGKCERCNLELLDGWHAHHKIPFIRGGLTEISNGMALCPKCHRKIESEEFIPRPAQIEMNIKTLAKVSQKEKTLTAILSCGTGKTLGAIISSLALYKEGIINGVIILTPRQKLCKQYEDCWSGSNDDKDFSKYFNDNPGAIRARKNKLPVLWKDTFGYAITYAALVSDSKKAKREQVHYGEYGILSRKFLLVLDEAQCLGDNNNENKSLAYTKAVQKLADHPNCKFIIVMTATDIRSDSLPLPFAKYSNPNEYEEVELLSDIRWTYIDGVTFTPRYLRPFDFNLLTFEQVWENKGIEITDEMENGYTEIIKQPKVWRKLALETVNTLQRVKDEKWEGYKGMIAACDKEHATEISKFLSKKGIKCLTVITNPENKEENGNITSKLDEFDKGDYDILINVRMAYIGYDNPSITVVGVLTGWTFPSFLEQLIGRGGRILQSRPIEEQELFVVALNTPRMKDFVNTMRNATTKAIKLNTNIDDIIYENWIERIGGKDSLEKIDTLLEINELASIGMGTIQLGDLDKLLHNRVKEYIKQVPLTVSPSQLAIILRQGGGNIETFLGDTVSPKKPKEIFTSEDIKNFNSSIDSYVKKIATLKCRLKISNYQYNSHMNFWRKEKMDKDKELWGEKGKSNFGAKFNTEYDYGKALYKILMQLISEEKQLAQQCRSINRWT